MKSTDGIRHFHAHIYFDARTRDKAWALRERTAEAFGDVQVGRFHEREVGPHSAWMYQVAFRPDQFGFFVPWLALNRDGLSVLVHPGTGDGLADHTDHAIWMGDRLPIKRDHWKVRRPPTDVL